MYIPSVVCVGNAAISSVIMAAISSSSPPNMRDHSWGDSNSLEDSNGSVFTARVFRSTTGFDKILHTRINRSLVPSLIPSFYCLQYEKQFPAFLHAIWGRPGNEAIDKSVTMFSTRPGNEAQNVCDTVLNNKCTLLISGIIILPGVLGVVSTGTGTFTIRSYNSIYI